MRIRLLVFTVLALGLLAAAQDAPPPSQAPEQHAGPGRGMSQGRGWGGGMAGRGVVGVVTQVAPDHYTVKNENGDLYTVNYSVNTRILKQPAQRPTGDEMMRTPPEEIKPADIKVGDAIMARGEMDPATKSVGAIMVVKIDPERARQMQAMEANFGKTWLVGRVTKVEETKVTIESPVDNAEHTFVADENTSFQKRRAPATLAEVEVGASVRVEGAVKQGVFVATTVTVLGPPISGGPAHHQGVTPPQ